MPADESAIQLMELPELWPPLDQPRPGQPAPDQEAPATPGASPYPSDANPLPSAQGPTPTLEQAPALPRQFAVLLAEVLAGMRPEQQVASWLSKRGTLHLHRLMPSFKTGHQPRLLRVLTTRPAPDVVEMTMIVAIGARPRALAVRLEHGAQPGRWQCTDIESA